MSLVQIVLEQTLRLVEIFFYEAINSEQRLIMEMANPLLESFGEPPRTRMTNSRRPPTDLKEKGNPDLSLVCSNYWPPIIAQFEFEVYNTP